MDSSNHELDPQVAALLERVKVAGLPSYHTVSPSEARRMFLETRRALQPPAPDVASAEDFVIPGPGGSIPVRYYRPKGSTPGQELPALVYYHGGGWVIGDLSSHDVLCRELANQAHCAVVSVEYRKAPEHKFPAAVDDAVAAFSWIRARAVRRGIDATRIAVGGDSAGGNLATVVALLARDAGLPMPCFQLLIYPATEQGFGTRSHQAYGQGYLLTRENMQWFMTQYLRSAMDGRDWRASPLLARNFAGLPPASVLVAGFDPLCDEGVAYAKKLKQAGVPVKQRLYPGMVHGFIIMGGVLDVAEQAIADCAEDLRAALGGGPAPKRAAAKKKPAR
jgi:acetyl esterase